MDDNESSITQKIQSLKLELARKQRKLKKWTNKVNKITSNNQSELNSCYRSRSDDIQKGLFLKPNLDKTTSIESGIIKKDFSKILKNIKPSESHNISGNRSCKDGDNINILQNDNENRMNPSNRRIQDISPIFKHPQNLDDFKETEEPAKATCPPVLFHYDEIVQKKLSNQYEDDEELFPDIDQEVSDNEQEIETISEGENNYGTNPQNLILDVGPDVNLKLNCLERLSNESVCPLQQISDIPELIKSNISDIVKESTSIDNECTPRTETDSSKSTSGMDSGESSLKRRSIRLASRICPDFKQVGKKLKLDVNSVIDVAFEILVQLARTSEINDFDLPDNDFKDFKQEKLINRMSLEKHCALTVKCNSNVSLPRRTLPCLSRYDASEGIASKPSTLNLKANILENEYSCAKDSVNQNDPILEHTRDFPMQVVPTENVNYRLANSIKNTTVECGTLSQCGNSSVANVSLVEQQDLCLAWASEPFNESVCLDTKTDAIVEDRDISEVCESVLKTVIDILVISLSEKECSREFSCKNSKEIKLLSDEVLNKSSEVLHFAASHSLKCEAEPVEEIFMLKADGTDFLVIHQRSCFIGWHKKEQGWMKMPEYFINNDVVILDVGSLGSSLAVLILAQTVSLNILTIANNQIHLKSIVELVAHESKFLQEAVTGSLCYLREASLIATCLLSNGNQPQIQLHSLKFDQYTKVCNLESPPGDDLLMPIVSVQGSTRMLLGLYRENLFFWNISSGLLLKTVPLKCKAKITFFKKCIWAKIEKDLLFGIFQEELCEIWKMVVVNPATGVYQHLCHYVCSSCQPASDTFNKRCSKAWVQCHQLLLICKQRHLTVFDLLTAKPLITSKMRDPGAAILNNSSLTVGNAVGIIDIFEVKL